MEEENIQIEQQNPQENINPEQTPEQDQKQPEQNNQQDEQQQQEQQIEQENSQQLESPSKIEQQVNQESQQLIQEQLSQSQIQQTLPQEDQIQNQSLNLDYKQSSNFENQQNDNTQPQQQQSQIKQRRRTRNDNSDRNYTCGCGKAYLSYPALYTHLKQKHQGKAPEGTQLPQNQMKSNLKSKGKEDIEKTGTEQQFENPYKIDVVEDLLAYLDTLDKEYRRNLVKSEEGENPNENIQQQYEENLFEEYEETLQWKEIHSFLNKNQTLDLGSSIDQAQQQKQSADEIKLVPVNQILAHFIQELNKVIKDSVMKEIIFLICLFRKALNEYGYLAGGEELEQYIEETQGKKEEEQQQNLENEEERPEFASQQLGDFSLLIVNDFLIELLPQYIKQHYERLVYPYQLIGQTDQKIKNAVFIIYHLADWMFLQHYTNTKLVFKIDAMNEENEQEKDQNQNEQDQDQEQEQNQEQENEENNDQIDTNLNIDLNEGEQIEQEEQEEQEQEQEREKDEQQNDKIEDQIQSEQHSNILENQEQQQQKQNEVQEQQQDEQQQKIEQE